MLARLAPLLLLCACASKLPFDAPEQPELAKLAIPYAQQLRSVGITQVISAGSGAMVRLETLWGSVYVPYPHDVPPAAFALYIDQAGLSAASPSFNQDRDARVLGSILPVAIRETASNNTFQWLRANPWN
jgi:hypothetical protein